MVAAFSSSFFSPLSFYICSFSAITSKCNTFTLHNARKSALWYMVVKSENGKENTRRLKKILQSSALFCSIYTWEIRMSSEFSASSDYYWNMENLLNVVMKQGYFLIL